VPERHLETWTIYESPADFPGRFVLRRWTIRSDGQLLPDPVATAIVGTLEEARRAVPRGLYCQPRNPGDDPVIVEVWF